MVIIGILANRADIPICVIRSHGETVERRVMAKVISICNQKGGCGKSTLTENLSALANCGAKVLLVDLDPSGRNATERKRQKPCSTAVMIPLPVHSGHVPGCGVHQ